MTDSARGLRVGYVLRRFPEPSQTFVLNEIRALERLGHRVTVIALEAPVGQSPGDERHCREVVQIESAGWDRLLRGLAAALLRRPGRLLKTLGFVIRTNGADVWRAFRRALILAQCLPGLRLDHLHAHLHYGTLALWLVHRLTGCAFGFTAHAREIYVRHRYLPQQLTDACYVITVCAFNRDRMLKQCPHLASKIHVVHPVLDQALINAGDEAGAAVPAFVAGSGSRAERIPVRLISVGRLVPKKGMAVLIEALHALIERGVEPVLTIVGDGQERLALNAQVDRLGLAGRVVLLGPQQPTAVRAELSKADCFVLGCVQTPDGDADATPTVLGEAMAMGLPVISTRLSGIPEIVPENAGLLVPPGDPSALAGAIAEIAAMPTERRRMMGQCGRRFVHEHWNGSKDVHRLVGLFRQAVRR